ELVGEQIGVDVQRQGDDEGEDRAGRPGDQIADADEQAGQEDQEKDRLHVSHVSFTSERDTNALYLQINPTRARSQVDSRLPLSFVPLAANRTRAHARAVGGGTPEEVLPEAQASGDARAVPAEVFTFDQVHALVLDGGYVGILADFRQMLRAEVVGLVGQED